MRGLQLLVVAAGVAAMTPALGQRRGDETAARRLELTLGASLAFDQVTVPAGRYVVSVGEASLALSGVDAMVVFATLPATLTQAASAAPTPTVELVTQGPVVTVVVKSQDLVWTSAPARVVTENAARTTLVALAPKEEAAGAGGIPQEASAVALVDKALVRLLPELRPCADQAHKARWQTDDPKFVRCACPLLDKWRLPKVQAAVRVHRAILLGKSGVSFTATPEGKAVGCRVWTGLKSPEELAEATAPTPAAAP